MCCSLPYRRAVVTLPSAKKRGKMCGNIASRARGGRSLRLLRRRPSSDSQPSAKPILTVLLGQKLQLRRQPALRFLAPRSHQRTQFYPVKSGAFGALLTRHSTAMPGREALSIKQDGVCMLYRSQPVCAAC